MPLRITEGGIAVGVSVGVGVLEGGDVEVGVKRRSVGEALGVSARRVAVTWRAMTVPCSGGGLPPVGTKTVSSGGKIVRQIWARQFAIRHSSRDLTGGS
jgi:hypothetical protein